MSRVLRMTARHAVLGSALAGLTMVLSGAATAGDLGPPVYSPAPYVAAPYGTAPYGTAPYVAAPYVAAPYDAPHAACRVLLERRIDPYGRETVHRIRMCDDGPVYPGLGETAAPPEYSYPPPRYYAPSPSGYDPYPRPPAPIPGYFY